MVQENEMFSLELLPKYGFQWSREVVDPDYVVVNHEDSSPSEENVLRTRASTYVKAVGGASPRCPAYEVSPTKWATTDDLDG